jgi:hypothetical protein
MNGDILNLHSRIKPTTRLRRIILIGKPALRLGLDLERIRLHADGDSGGGRKNWWRGRSHVVQALSLPGTHQPGCTIAPLSHTLPVQTLPVLPLMKSVIGPQVPHIPFGPR